MLFSYFLWCYISFLCPHVFASTFQSGQIETKSNKLVRHEFRCCYPLFPLLSLLWGNFRFPRPSDWFRLQINRSGRTTLIIEIDWCLCSLASGYNFWLIGKDKILPISLHTDPSGRFTSSSVMFVWLAVASLLVKWLKR